MKKLSDVPFDKIYAGIPVIIPAYTFLQDDVRFIKYGEKIFFPDNYGVVIEKYHGQHKHFKTKNIGSFIIIQFINKTFPFIICYENLQKINICLDPTRM